MNELLLGVDLGTTGTRTALFTCEGTVLAEATATTPLRWHGPGWVDQDPDAFYHATLRTIRSCLHDAAIESRRVAAVGVTGQMAGVLGIDATWSPSTPYDSWLDQRCSSDVEDLARLLGQDLIERTGCPAMVNHAPKLRWRRREQPDAFARTAAFIMPSGYVAGKLAGLSAADAFIDYTYLHFTGLVDARAGTWADDLAAAVGVPISKLPRIVAPAAVIGSITRAAAAACGLPSGVAVAAGLGDTAAGALGAGLVHEDQLLDTAGTAAVLAVSTTTFQPDTRHHTMLMMRGALDGQWIALSYLSGGNLLEWFGELLSDDAGALTFEQLTALCAEVGAGSDGVLFIPHLDGRILPSDPTMRGAWVGLDRHHTKRHLGRAILESVAYEYATYLDIVRRLQPDLTPYEARVIGGGARNALWNRIKASVLGVPYVRLQRDEFSCWGAALIAGHAVGLFDDLAAAATRTTAVGERFEPNWEEHGVYMQMVGPYGEALDALAAPSRALAALHRRGKEE